MAVCRTSYPSSIPRPLSSIPRFPNLAILASVPASVTVFVMTLCAERLYSGIIRRAEDEDEPEAFEEASDVTDATDGAE